MVSVADREHAHGHYKSPVADRAHARYADSHEMVTLNASKLLLLINQPKLTVTVTLTQGHVKCWVWEISED